VKCTNACIAMIARQFVFEKCELKQDIIVRAERLS
jgi:hypothetical protein